MCPLQLNSNEAPYVVDVIPSRILEITAVINILANRKRNSFEIEFTERLYQGLSEKSKSFLNSLSGMNFAGVEFIGFLFNEKIYDDLEALINRVVSYHGIDFIYLALDKDVTKDRLKEVSSNREEFQTFFDEYPCSLCKGNPGSLKALLYDTENYKNSLAALAKEISADVEFNKRLGELEETYRQSVNDIRSKLFTKAPFEIISEIKNKYAKHQFDYKHYYFLPSYFLNGLKVASRDAESFMLFYSIQSDEPSDGKELDHVLSIFKSLSDKTRLQILQHLKNKPAYGKQIAEKFGLSTANISRQLEQLRSMNLITEEKSDNFKYFSLNKPEIEKMLNSIQDFFSEK